MPSSARQGGSQHESLRVATANWPTPRGTDRAKGGPNQAGSRGDLMLPSAAAMWTTPQAHDSAGGHPDRVRRFGTKHGGANLADDVTMWSTPNVPNGGRAMTPEQVAKRGATESGKRQVGLENEAKFWSTPNAHDGRRPGADLKSTQGANLNLDAVIWGAESAWPTPKARDFRSAVGQAGTERDSPDLNVIAYHFSHPDQPTPKHGQQSSQSGQTSRRLSPAFVEWLMAVPLGWTDFAPLGTEWSRYRQQLRSACSRIVRKFSGMEVPNEG